MTTAKKTAAEIKKAQRADDRADPERHMDNPRKKAKPALAIVAEVIETIDLPAAIVTESEVAAMKKKVDESISPLADKKVPISAAFVDATTTPEQRRAAMLAATKATKAHGAALMVTLTSTVREKGTEQAKVAVSKMIESFQPSVRPGACRIAADSGDGLACGDIADVGVFFRVLEAAHGGALKGSGRTPSGPRVEFVVAASGKSGSIVKALGKTAEGFGCVRSFALPSGFLAPGANVRITVEVL